VAAPRRTGRTLARLLSVLLPLLGLCALPGCDDTYDEYLLYPLRKDWIVKDELKVTPPRIDPPGFLPLQILDGRTELRGVSDNLIGEMEAKKIINPRDVLQDRDTSEELMKALRDLAGRPRYPKIDTSDDALNDRLEKELKLDRKTLAAGSVLFRRNCLHCHGLSGDGRGPTGLWINAHPRDFRSGAFKYTSVGGDEGARKPRRDDLRRILTFGIDGTAMPSFALMKPEDQDAVISYVIHLSIRGEAEIETIKALIEAKVNPEDEAKQPIVDRLRYWAGVEANRWLAASTLEIKPTAAPEYKGDEALAAAARGYKFFTRPDQCVQCHTNFGRDSDYRYDTWGTIVKPRNLVNNQYGGGRRPLDFYYRIHSGIRGSGMPAFPLVNAQDPALKDAETRERTMWDLVALIQTLPYPEERAKLRKAHGIFLD
jgi:mono/diheme cytochrome c family protein